jgi:hypothetical protein
MQHADHAVAYCMCVHYAGVVPPCPSSFGKLEGQGEEHVVDRPAGVIARYAFHMGLVGSGHAGSNAHCGLRVRYKGGVCAPSRRVLVETGVCAAISGQY